MSLADNLRAVAELLDAHPELPEPYITTQGGRANLNWFLQLEGNEAEQKATAAVIVKTLGGKWNKRDHYEGKFAFAQTRGGVDLFVQVTREAVCERVVTGTKTVTVPAKPAEPEQVIEREIVEWRCESLLAEAKS